MGGARRSKMKGRTTICVLAAAVCLLDSLTRADVDDNDYAWDPNDRTGSKASTAADMEGTLEAPSNLWHACKFGAKKGGIFDLRGLSRNAKLLQAHLGWNTDKFNDKIQLYDWVHQDVTQFNVTYYLNVCADVIEVPEVCAQLKMTEPAPAYQVTATGRCHYLGTLKSFKWKPIDTVNPGKGMMLFYQNGAAAATKGRPNRSSMCLLARGTMITRQAQWLCTRRTRATTMWCGLACTAAQRILSCSSLVSPAQKMVPMAPASRPSLRFC